MTAAVDLIALCRDRGLRLRAINEGLGVAPLSKLDEELRRQLVEHKPEILRLLAANDDPRRATVFEVKWANSQDWTIAISWRGETLDEIRTALKQEFGDRIVDVRRRQGN